MLLIFTPCKCAAVVNDPPGLRVIDSEKLAAEEIQIGWTELNGIRYNLNETFVTREALVGYLNNIFSTALELEGLWTDEDGFIVYSNPENFDSIEIMSIYSTRLTILRIGTPPYNISGTAIDVPNGTLFSLPTLIGEELIQVNLAASAPMERSSQTGYVWNKNTGQLDISGSGGAQTNTYAYIIHSQTSA